MSAPSSNPIVVPGDGALTSREYDALHRDMHSLRDDVADDRKAVFDKLDQVIAIVKAEHEAIRQDLAIRDHQIAETTLKLHKSSMANQETLKGALTILHERFEQTYAADAAWKESFRARVVHLYDKDVERDRVEDASDIPIPGLRPAWSWWQRTLALAALLVGAGTVGSALTACAARGGLLESHPDATTEVAR